MTASTEYRPRYVAEHAEGGVVYGPPSDQCQLAERGVSTHQQLIDGLRDLVDAWEAAAGAAGESLLGRQARSHAESVRALVDRYRP